MPYLSPFTVEPKSNNGVPIQNAYMTSYLMAIIMFAVVYEIFPNEIKCQKFDLDNGGQGEEGRNGTGNISLEMFEYVTYSEC